MKHQSDNKQATHLKKLIAQQKQKITQLQKQIKEKNIKNQKLSDESEHLENIIALMPGHVYWQDKNNTFLGCNDIQAKQLGFQSRREIIGKTNFDLPYTKAEADAIDKLNLNVMKTGKAFVAEETVSFDKEVHLYLSQKVPLRDKKNKIIGMLGISFDITERKKMELELLEAKERAETANKAKSEFFAAINHELRTPLTGILGMARLLASESLKAEHQKQVADIITSGEHLLSLVNDLLDMAKLEAGKRELHNAPVDLRKLIEEVATMLILQAKSKGLEMRVNYPTGIPHLVIADAKAIRQILLNLIGNSLKFTHKGHIEIKVECIKKTAKNAKLKLTISDTGIGIPRDKIDGIFDRFNQVDNSRNRQYGGTGLGLTINKDIVELMGGTIHVDSEPNKGSNFACIINFALQNKSTLTSTWEPYKAKVRILVIDDSLQGEVIRKHIGSSFCEIISSKEALNYLLAAQQHQEPFDVVIMDEKLKYVNASKLAKSINQQKSLSKPMLLLMMKAGPISKRKTAKTNGFVDCLIKPIHPTELLTTLTAAWEKWEENLQPTHTIIPIDRKQLLKILLVEDDLIVQKVHSEMLKKIGCAVDVTANGQQALEIFNNGYDVIFMDVGLGQMSGMEVTSEIRRREQGKHHIPIIAMTGYGDNENKESCLSAGMDDIIIKPTTPETLKTLLETWAKK